LYGLLVSLTLIAVILRYPTPSTLLLVGWKWLNGIQKSFNILQFR
jgi:hypothetical protein